MKIKRQKRGGKLNNSTTKSNILAISIGIVVTLLVLFAAMYFVSGEPPTAYSATPCVLEGESVFYDSDSQALPQFRTRYRRR